jgi:hypothetical protein
MRILNKIANLSMPSKLIILLLSIISLNACNNGYDGPGPQEPQCKDFPSVDTVENLKGTVKIVDTSVYISTYVDQTTDLRYYPCNILPSARKDGFPIEYSGHVKKRGGDNKSYIELTDMVPILNETIITNYRGLIRNRDSLSIPANEKSGVIKDHKIENGKLKLLLSYTGCTKGRTQFISLYKTTQSQGEIRVYGLITAPYESCLTSYTLWYEIDAQFYKDHTFVLYDGVKTYEFYIPK